MKETKSISIKLRKKCKDKFTLFSFRQKLKFENFSSATATTTSSTTSSSVIRSITNADMLEAAEDKWDIQIAVVDHDKDKVDMSLYEHTVSFTTLHHPLP